MSLTCENQHQEEVPEPKYLADVLKEKNYEQVDSEISLLKKKYGIGQSEPLQHYRASSLDVASVMFKRSEEPEVPRRHLQFEQSQYTSFAQKSVPESDKQLDDDSDYQLLLKRFNKMEEFYKKRLEY